MYRNLDQLVLGTFLFSYSLHAGLHSGQVAKPRNHWPDQGLSNGTVFVYNAGFLEKLRICRFVTI